jgi:DNA-binding NarL/FixJ family response regulator
MVLGERCDLNEVVTTFRAGADGYVLKTISPEALMKSLDLLMLPSSILLTALANGGVEIDPPSEIRAAPTPVAAEAMLIPTVVQQSKISEACDAVPASERDPPERALPLTLTDRETAILRGTSGKERRCPK